MNGSIEKKRRFRWALLALMLLVVWLAENTAGIFFGANNFRLYLMVGAVSAIAMLEEALPSALFGLFGGLLTDLFTPGQLGFHSIMLLLVGLFTSLCVSHFMRSTLLTSLMFSGAALLVYVCCYWLFMIVFKGYGGLSALFTMFLPRALATWLLCPVLYLLVRRLRKALV